MHLRSGMMLQEIISHWSSHDINIIWCCIINNQQKSVTFTPYYAFSNYIGISINNTIVTEPNKTCNLKKLSCKLFIDQFTVTAVSTLRAKNDQMLTGNLTNGTGQLNIKCVCWCFRQKYYVKSFCFSWNVIVHFNNFPIFIQNFSNCLIYLHALVNVQKLWNI